MIYDLSQVKNVAALNDTVVAIRAAIKRKLPNEACRQNTRQLIKCMSVEACEEILNEVFNLPWIPMVKGNVLTNSQVAKVCSYSPNVIHTIAKGANDSDRELIHYRDLEKIAAYKIPYGIKSHGHTSSLAFSNGTSLFSPARKFFVLNPRAVLYVLVSVSNKSRALAEFFDSLLNRIYTEDEWILPIPANTAAPAKKVPVAKKADAKPIEAAVKKITAIVTEPAKDPNPAVIRSEAKKIDLKKHTEPKPVKQAPAKAPVHGLPEDAILGFINRLRPGTEIRIVVPA